MRLSITSANLIILLLKLDILLMRFIVFHSESHLINILLQIKRKKNTKACEEGILPRQSDAFIFIPSPGPDNVITKLNICYTVNHIQLETRPVTGRNRHARPCKHSAVFWRFFYFFHKCKMTWIWPHTYISVACGEECRRFSILFSCYIPVSTLKKISRQKKKFQYPQII